jgi:hypothetical protein
VLVELTCCAEEGLRNAQLRKETKYTKLLGEINDTCVWKASLLTLEVCARGLVGLSTHKAFVQLGLPSSQAGKLCKKLSVVVARCSYAIYLAHNNLSWSHGKDLIVLQEPKKLDEVVTQALPVKVRANIQILRENGVKALYHFTDVSNLDSIRKHGLVLGLR